MIGVLLVFAHLLLTVGALAVLALCGLRLWGKVKATKRAAMELKDRVADLSTMTTELAARLDTTEVTSRLAERTG